MGDITLRGPFSKMVQVKRESLFQFSNRELLNLAETTFWGTLLCIFPKQSMSHNMGPGTVSNPFIWRPMSPPIEKYGDHSQDWQQWIWLKSLPTESSMNVTPEIFTQTTWFPNLAKDWSKLKNNGKVETQRLLADGIIVRGWYSS